jgi:hypothetical protein
MKFAMSVTVGLEISGISVDIYLRSQTTQYPAWRSSSTDIPEISNPTVTHMAKFIYRYI